MSGASSYTIFKDGIEIEVDAHNKVSLNLSKKLGYNFDKEYDAYEIYNW